MDTQSRKKKRGEKSGNSSQLDFIISEPLEVKKNELYLFACEASHFQNLISTHRSLHTLVIIGQPGITSLNGISNLINLQELWVVECLVQDISDLERCCKLVKLYLYSNSINEIPNMSNSTELKLLSLSGNKISHLENFNSMPKLRELYLANNRIKKIGDSFLQSPRLTVMNLAGNTLYQLQDIQNLSFLPSLQSVVFADPMYGECPLVSLSAYRYFVINYLPTLNELDHYRITSEERSYVTEFFKSKIMFYNMLWHKYLDNFAKSLKERLTESKQRIREYREDIYIAKLGQLRITRNNEVPAISRELLSHEILREIYSDVDAYDALKEQWIKNAKIKFEIIFVHGQMLQRQLSLTVQHCGNMNFTQYMPGAGNALVQICQDICNDSLCPTVKQDLGIIGVHVHCVTKVVNNTNDALRLCNYFNESTTDEEQSSDSVFTFLVKPVEVVGFEKWPFDVFDQEFFDEREIITSDCLAAADAEWAARISSKQKSSIDPLYSPNEHRIAILVQLPLSVLTTKVEKQDNYHRMHLGFNEDTCRCLSIVNPEHAKPVFAVEYEYIFENGSEKYMSKKPRREVVRSNPTNTWPILDFANLLKCLSLTELDICKLQIIDLCGHGIYKLGAMTDLPNLRELNLSYNKLTAIPDSSMLKSVRKLDVSFNEIQSFGMDTCLPLLESLNAAWNSLFGFIESLESLKTIAPNLITLNVKHNPFNDVITTEATSSLAQAAIPSLKYFNEKTFCHTTHAGHINQHPWIIDHFEMADWAKLRVIKHNLEGVISEPNKRLTSPLLINNTQLENVQYANLVDNQLSGVEFITEFQQLKEIYLANNLLTKILLDKSANNLTKLSLCCNFVVKMDGIIQENLPVLNYLDLSNNLITSLTSMGVFYTLTEFYCSHNNISTLSQICNLKNWIGLKIVDISNNPIDCTSLCKKFIIFHISKVEYVGGECVTSSDILEANQTFGGSLDKDTIVNMPNVNNLQNLKQLSITNCAIKKVNLTEDLLPNLESLDLRQNQITTLCGLHTLKKLQTLSLSHNQIGRSMTVYQKDLVLPKLLFPNLVTLFLDHNGIRSLVEFNFQSMPMLKYLFLQHNELQDVNGVQGCAGLETLVVDHNKIQMITEEDFHSENNIRSFLSEYNKIKFLNFVRRLSKIEKLFVSNNKLSDKDQIKNLGQLKHLKEITILGNPLCKRTNHYKLALQALVTLRRIDGHSVMPKDYLDDE